MHIFIASSLMLPTVLYTMDERRITINNIRNASLYISVAPSLEQAIQQPFTEIKKLETYNTFLPFDDTAHLLLQQETRPQDGDLLEYYVLKAHKSIKFEFRKTYEQLEASLDAKRLERLLKYGYIDQPEKNYSMVLRAKKANVAKREDIQYGTVLYSVEKIVDGEFPTPLLIPVEPPKQEPPIEEPPIVEPPIEKPPEKPTVLELPPIELPPTQEPPIEEPKPQPKTVPQMETEIKEIQSRIKSLEKQYNRLTTKIGATKEQYKDTLAAKPRPEENLYMNW